MGRYQITLKSSSDVEALIVDDIFHAVAENAITVSILEDGEHISSVDKVSYIMLAKKFGIDIYFDINIDFAIPVEVVESIEVID